MLRDVHREGPLGSCRRVLEEIIAAIDNGLPVEEERFPELIVEARSAWTISDANRTAAGISRPLRRWNWAASLAWFKLGPARAVTAVEMLAASILAQTDGAGGGQVWPG